MTSGEPLSSTKPLGADEALLDDVDSELIDVEAVLGDLDDLERLGLRVQTAVADGSIAHRPVLQRCSEHI